MIFAVDSKARAYSNSLKGEVARKKGWAPERERRFGNIVS